MAVLRYLVPAVAVAGRLAAAASCSAATTTIQNQGDASALASCSTFSGSIAIATGTTDAIALNGIQAITGSIIANNVTQLTSLGADSLTTIGESFSLESLTRLSTLSFPMLTEVDSIDWVVLPALQELSFNAGLQEVSSLMIDNTQLNSLTGINLVTADVIFITNNNYLADISMQLGNVTQALTVSFNGRSLSVNFPNLEWVYNMTLQNCAKVSIPSLASVNTTLGFYTNTLSSIAAPNLTTVGGDLSFDDNPQVTNLSFPELTSVGGGFTISSNAKLQNIDGFPLVAVVGGALRFDGSFTNVSLPKIDDVRGAFNLTSTGDIDAACQNFEQYSGQNNVIKGTYTCNSGGNGSTSVDGSGTGTSSGSSPSSTSSKGAAHGLVIPGATGLLGVVAAIFGLL